MNEEHRDKFKTALDELTVLSCECGDHMAEEEITARFLLRQEESNTAVSPFLAIPHIIIDGKDKMFLTIIRCKEGVKFTDSEDSVKAVFVLGGTQEKRLLHLKTLAAIATLVDKKGFEQEWLNAANTIELKNLMVLSERKRFL